MSGETANSVGFQTNIYSVSLTSSLGWQLVKGIAHQLEQVLDFNRFVRPSMGIAKAGRSKKHQKIKEEILPNRMVFCAWLFWSMTSLISLVDKSWVVCACRVFLHTTSNSDGVKGSNCLHFSYQGTWILCRLPWLCNFSKSSGIPVLPSLFAFFLF